MRGSNPLKIGIPTSILLYHREKNLSSGQRPQIKKNPNGKATSLKYLSNLIDYLFVSNEVWRMVGRTLDFLNNFLSGKRSIYTMTSI
jgi:hypothetical protein